MIKTREYYSLLIKGRKNLSLIIFLSKIWISLTWAGVFCGLVVLVLQWLYGAGDLAFLPFDFLGLWLIVTLLSAGCLGFIFARKERVDFQKTAEWLDHNLDLKEVLSSAYLCLERNCSGPFDEKLVEAAELCAAGINSHPEQIIKWPVYKVKQQMKVALLTVLFVTALLAWWHPKKNDSFSLKKLTLKDEITQVWAESSQTAELLLNYSAREVADLLFSTDQKLAEDAEQALKTGNAAAFHEALEQAAAENAVALQEETSAALFDALRQEQKTSYQARRFPEGAEGRDTTGPGTGGGAQNGEEGDGQGDSSAGQKSGEGRERTTKEAGGEGGEEGEAEQRDSLQEQAASDAKISGGRKKGTPEAADDNPPLNKSSSTDTEEKDEMTSNPYPAQSIPGKGGGKEETDWGDPEAKLKEQAIITENEDGEFLEYLLPGTEATAPLFKFIPHLQQATEAALERQVISLEYEEFVRDYYLQLYKELAPPEESE